MPLRRLASTRLAVAGEEALAVLERQGGANPGRQVAVSARPGGRSTEVEFATMLASENVEGRLAHLDDLPPAPNEGEVSFRLLRHHASDVCHQRQNGADVITVTVDRVVEDGKGP